MNDNRGTGGPGEIIAKVLGFVQSLAAGLFWIATFVWLFFFIWIPDWPHLGAVLRLAVSGLLIWVASSLGYSIGHRAPPGGRDEQNGGSGATAYPHGKTKETLNFVIALAATFLVLTLLVLNFAQTNACADAMSPALAQFSRLLCGNEEALVVMFAAGVGSSLATVLAFLKHAVTQKDFESRFMPWYLLRPIMGALLGLIFYFLVKGGLLLLGVEAAGGGDDGESVGELNLHALAGLGAIVGFLSREAIEKLREVFRVMFSSSTAGRKPDGGNGEGDDDKD